MHLRGRPGNLFVVVDADLTRSKEGIWFPPTLHGKAKTGLCVHHNVTKGWMWQGEASLEGKRIIFDRFGGRPFKLQWKDGKEYTFVCVSQWGVLAIIEEETCLST